MQPAQPATSYHGLAWHERGIPGAAPGGQGAQEAIGARKADHDARKVDLPPRNTSRWYAQTKEWGIAHARNAAYATTRVASTMLAKLLRTGWWHIRGAVPPPDARGQLTTVAAYDAAR